MSKWSERLLRLPPYLFAGLEAKASELRTKGVDLIDLGIGDPDLPPVPEFESALRDHLHDADAHLYPTSMGDPAVRTSIARWAKIRFGVEVDPASEVCVLLGAKEGLANLARAYVNLGDRVAVPDPAYPVYANGATILCDGVPVSLPLDETKGMLPDLSTIPDEVRMLYLNYPNNPTGAIATSEFFTEVAQWTEAHPECVVVQDNAYSELTFAGYQAPALLQHTRKGIEFFSLSKVVNATGYRIGWAIGDPDIIRALVKVKTQLDSGAPVFIQRAAAAILDYYTTPGQLPDCIAQNLSVYGERRVTMENGLRQLGIEFLASSATFYVWAKVPKGWDDVTFVDAAMEKGVIVTPGRGFGKQGEHRIRFALTQPTERIIQALARIATL
ncbi:MAG: aminotransferase class I/II-fold pyridoxal phosphate-dependent enzyme [bacterium]|nr:aminotransferase class I/II-fold pyridoxal phosphate-dependent enzyme [bacterium]